MRRLLLALLVVHALALPISLLVLADQLGLLRGINAAVSGASMADVIVENQTAQSLVVTPLGTADSGRLRPLPLFDQGDPHAPATQRARYPVEPGQRLRLHYAWHDHRISHLVVEDAAGRQVELPGSPASNVKPSPTRAADFVITDLAAGSPVSKDVLDAYRQAIAPPRTGRLWPWLAPLASFPFVLLCFVRVRKRHG